MVDRIICSLILNYNDAERSVRAAKRLAKNESFKEVLVVDNCSTDGSLSLLRKELEDPKISIVKSKKNGGYGYGNNYGLRYLMHKYGEDKNLLVLIANPDTSIQKSAIYSMIRCFDLHEGCLACAPRQLTVNGRFFNDTAWPISSPIRYAATSTLIGKLFLRSKHYKFDFNDHSEYIPVDCLSGALLMVDVKKLFSIGGYHEEMFLFCEETSIGVRAKDVYKSYLISKETYVHEHSTSINAEFSSFMSQFRILRASRLYVLRHDYNVRGLELVVCSLLDFFSRIEAPFKGIILNIFR